MVKMILTDAVAEGIEMNAKFNGIMTEKITTLFSTENAVSKFKSMNKLKKI